MPKKKKTEEQPSLTAAEAISSSSLVWDDGSDISSVFSTLIYANPEVRSDPNIFLQMVQISGKTLRYGSPEMRDNERVVTSAVAQSGCALKYASKRLKADPDIIATAMFNDYEAIKYADTGCRNNRKLMEAAIDQSGLALQYASEEIRSNEELVRKAVSNHYQAFEYADPKFHSQRDILKDAVLQNGLALEYGSDELKNDRELAIAAIKESGLALQFLNKSLQNDLRIVHMALRQNGGALEFSGDSLKNDKKTVLIAVKQRGTALKFASDEMKKDRDIAVAAVKQTAWALEYVDPDFWSDTEIIQSAISQDRIGLDYANIKLRKKRDIVKAAVEYDGLAIQYADASLKTDKELLFIAIEKEAQAIEYAAKELLENRSFVKKAVELNPEVFQYLAEHWREDPEITLSAVSKIGKMLKYSSEANKKNMEIAWAAVENDPYAYFDIHPDLQKKQKLFYMALQKEPKILAKHPTYQLCPQRIPEFFYKLLSELKIERLLDLQTTASFALSELVQLFQPAEVSALYNTPEEKDIAGYYYQKLKNLSFINKLSETEGEYDFITYLTLSDKKKKKKNQRITITINEAEYEIIDTEAHMPIIEALPHLSENGVLAYMGDEDFINTSNPKAVINSLEKAGFHLFMALKITAPIVESPRYLYLIKRGPGEGVFQGVLTNPAVIETILVGNYHQKRSGRFLEAGIFVEQADFEHFGISGAWEEYLRMGKASDFNPNPFHKVGIINHLCYENKKDVVHIENSVYLHMDQTKRDPSDRKYAVSKPLEMTAPPWQYIQIVLFPDICHSAYMLDFLRSKIGRVMLKSISFEQSGTLVNLSKLYKVKLYLPDLALQSEVMQLHQQVKQLESELRELKKNLWKYPKSIKKISKQLEQLNQNGSSSRWFSLLPFPLASILWRYHASTDPNERESHLLHFFEALSEFLSMIMLSSLAQDPAFYENEKHHWINHNDRFRGWYLKASFGGWIHLSFTLSKAIRRYLNQKETRQLCRNFFGNPSENFFSLLLDKRLYNTLQEVNEFRNISKGHTAISGKAEHEQRVFLLEEYLLKIRPLLAEGFEDTILIQPETARYQGGAFENTVKQLTGMHFPFAQTELQTKIPLDTNNLYLVHQEGTKPIEMLPLIRILNAPNTGLEACYFYSRVQGKNMARWVSYHFEPEPEIIEEDEALLKVFQLLKDH